jgi:hypothetical protein
MPFLAAASAASLLLIPTKFRSKTMLYSRHISDSCCTELLPLAGWDKQIVSHWLLFMSLYTAEAERKEWSHNCTLRKNVQHSFMQKC